MNTSHVEGQILHKGLGRKIILICTVPLIIMAGLNIFMSFNSAGLLNQTVTTLNEKAALTDTLLEENIDLNTALNDIQKVFSDLSSFHKQSLIQQNEGASSATRDMRAMLTQRFAPLQIQIADIAKTLKDSGFLSDTSAAGANLNKRINYLIRTANNLPRLFDLYAASNERTLVFLENRQFFQASNNVVFEERSREVTFQKRLDQTALVMSGLIREVDMMISESRLEFENGVFQDFADTANINYAILALVCGGLILFSIFFATKRISNPLSSIAAVTGSLSQGQLDVNIPKDQKDEIGDIANALEIFKQSLIENEQLARATLKERERSAAQQKEIRTQLANDFEMRIGDIVKSVTHSSIELKNTAQTMNEIASKNRQRAETAMQSSTDATQNVQTVAAAAEELSHSINEITRQVADSSNLASHAAHKAQDTNTTMIDLQNAAERIGTVINLITDIAGQTNLLALNATIEAARAGEAGKGFAVVASEVKNLANQTAKATEEISTQVRAIQETTDNAVLAIDDVSNMIDQMNQVSATIAASVEEQGGATREIAQNVEQAYQSTNTACGKMDELTQGAGKNQAASKGVLSSADGLTQQSQNLDEQVAAFLEQVRTG